MAATKVDEKDRSITFQVFQGGERFEFDHYVDADSQDCIRVTAYPGDTEREKICLLLDSDDIVRALRFFFDTAVTFNLRVPKLKLSDKLDPVEVELAAPARKSIVVSYSADREVYVIQKRVTGSSEWYEAAAITAEMLHAGVDEPKPPAANGTVPVDVIPISQSQIYAEYDGAASRDVVAMGRTHDSADYAACVFSNTGKLVVASTLPGFTGIR